MKAEPEKTQKPICTNVPKHIEAESEKDRNDELILDASLGVSEADFCDHMPDKLIPKNVDHQDDTITQHFTCKCGKMVDEIYRLSETRISE